MTSTSGPVSWRTALSLCAKAGKGPLWMLVTLAAIQAVLPLAGLLAMMHLVDPDKRRDPGRAFALVARQERHGQARCLKSRHGVSSCALGIAQLRGEPAYLLSVGRVALFGHPPLPAPIMAPDTHPHQAHASAR